MSQFKSNAHTVTAVQFYDSVDVLSSISQNLNVTISLNYATSPPEYKIVYNGSEITCKEGDWLVQYDATGRVSVLDDLTFRILYQSFDVEKSYAGVVCCSGR